MQKKIERNKHVFVTESTPMMCNETEKIVELLNSIIVDCSFNRTRGKNNRTYINVPAAFDIETTSFFEKDGEVYNMDYINNLKDKEKKKFEKKATMYQWQFGIDGEVIFGRTWDEFIAFCELLKKTLGLNKNTRLCCFVHNLPFEFQWMRKLLKWDDVFSMESRKVVYADSEGLEFRCSYILTGKGLAELAKDCHKYPCKKMMGDLDYNLLRNCKTPLTAEELGYCEMDVRVIMNYIKEQIEIEGSVKDIPLTKTGYARRYVRELCMPSNDKTARQKYQDLMKKLTLSSNEYEMLKRAFQGGFTHANPYNAFQIHNDVTSYDFSSSYPAIMVSKKMPMSKGKRVDVKSQKQFLFLIKNKCCLFDIKINGLHARDYMPDYYLSESKCWKLSKEHKTVNGRLFYADELETTVTEIDFELLQKCYTWDSYQIKNLVVYEKEYLPTPFVEAVLGLYEAKTTLKGVKGAEIEYQLKKGLLNALYGMTVTDINRDNVEYADEWRETAGNIFEAIDNYNNSKNRFIFYPWGVWITAYARQAVWSGIIAVGYEDHIYTDTDSIKIMNAEKHIDYINRYNNYIDNEMKKACEYHKIPFERTRPKTIKGEAKPLGRWDFDGKYKQFKTLGAKRYFVETEDGEFHMTVSGVDKHKAAEYMVKKYEKPLEAFDTELYIPYEGCGKLIHCYIDDEITGTITDYLGNVSEYKEQSGICLYGTGYLFGENAEFIDFCEGLFDIIA